MTTATWIALGWGAASGFGLVMWVKLLSRRDDPRADARRAKVLPVRWNAKLVVGMAYVHEDSGEPVR